MDSLDLDDVRAPRPIAPALIVFILLLAAVVGVMGALRMPAPVPEDGPDTEFSALRAVAHSRVIASEPHPAGSPANEKVPVYIVDTLRSYGIEAELVSELYVRGDRAGRRDMVLARIPGTAHTKAFALLAHYDSTPYGPGAADDGGGVAALIEIARAIKAGPPLMNDIIFVFTDGEEGSKLGSRAFGDHPWFHETGVLANLEARGTKGHSMMFGTVDQNGWLIMQFIDAVRYPVASSLGYDVYTRMPFSTDFDELRPLGMKGFDIAFTDNFAWYHTMNDRPEHISLSTLQHHGMIGLDLARHFGRLQLNGELSAPNAMYFNTLGYHMVRYPLSWGRPLAWGTAALVLLTVAVGRLRKHITLLGMLAGVIVLPITAAMSAAVCVLMLALVWGGDTGQRIYLENFTRIPDLTPMYHNNVYITAIAAATVAVTALIYGVMSRWIRAQSLLMGAYVWWTLGMLALTVYLPGASYLLMWPLAFSALSMLVFVTVARSGPMSPAWIQALTFFVVPAIMLCVPFYWSIGYTVTVLAAPGLAALAVLVLGLAIPQLDLMARVNVWWLPAVAASVATALVGYGLANSSFTPLRPKLNSVSYGIDYDANQAYWLSPDPAPDEWTRQFFDARAPRQDYAEFKESGGELVMKAVAPIAAEYPGPELSVLRDTTNEGTRELVIRVASPAHAAQLELRMVSDTPVLESSVFGQTIRGNEHGWRVRFNVFPKEGAELTLRVPADAPVQLRAREEFYGLPDIPGFEPRPDYMIPTPNTVNHGGTNLPSNHTWTVKTFLF